MTLAAVRRVALGGLLTLLITGSVWAGTYSNMVPVVINDDPTAAPTPAVPYPSTIAVSGETVVGKVTVTITGMTHTFPNDIEAMLVGPGGQNLVLMSDVCGGRPGIADVTLTFDDSGTDAPPCSTGTYLPVNSGDTSFPAPAPTPSTATKLSVFNGTNANGTWSLFVSDDESQDAGLISGGWSLNITSPTAVAVRYFRALPHSQGIGLYWRTTAEPTIAGFNVYRFSPGERLRVNRAMIPASLSTGDRIYRVLDTHVRAGVSYTYRLQLVKLDGSRSWYGSSSLTAR